MRMLAVATLILFGFSGPAVAAEVSEEAEVAIEKALTEAGCKLGEVEATDAGYEADDAECADGQYDVKLDKSYAIVEKKKE